MNEGGRGSKNGIKEGGGGDEVAKWVGVQLLTASHADSEGDLNANPHEDPDSYIQTASTSTTSHQISLQSFLYATIYSIFFFLIIVVFYKDRSVSVYSS